MSAARLPRTAARAFELTLVTAVLLALIPHAAGATASQDASVDREAVRDFFDTRVPASLERHRVPGATVAVVHGGEVVLAEGYGLADTGRGVRFDPETSLVRIASISKLFTWTAVMQLVEDGVLDLDRDVNAYLDDFQVPDTYPQPVTLVHLMSHTAGFEDRGIGIGAREKDDIVPLGDYLAAHLPARVRPPGEMSAYSNHGAALAGHIVAEVTGQPYERYVEDHILEPLGMHHATAWEPVPAHLARHMARSYQSDGDGWEPVPFVFDQLVPDGSVSASALDMARFMLAHLQDGRASGTRILDRATAQLMHAQSFTADPAVSGWAHGFKERTFNGRRTIMHDGSWEAFQSAMVLVPEEDLGVFVSFNGSGGIDAMGDLFPAFFERVLPAAETPQTPVATGDPGRFAGRIDGFYRSTRSSHTTVEKLLTLAGPARATTADDGTLRFTGRKWSPIAPTVYQEVGGTERLAVIPGDDGEVAYVATDGPAYARLAWHETIPANLAVLALFCVPALTVVVGCPVAWLVRRLRRRQAPASSASWRTARRLAGAACVVGLFFVVMMVLTLLGDTSEFLYGAPPAFRALMVVPVAFVALAVATVLATVRARAGGPVGRLAMAHQTVVVVGMVGLLWFLQQWNLVGWRFG